MKIRLIRILLARVLAVAILVLVGASPVFAANHYVRAGATGNGSGSDWTNACNDFAASCAVSTLVRGDTYYVATGTYGSRVFNRAESGALVITIKGATVADHGTDTGWQANFSVSIADGGAQAQFSFGPGESIEMGTSNWVFDGVVGSGSNAASYGFLMKQPSNCNTNPQGYFQVANVGGTITNITVRHISIVSCGPAFDVAQRGFVLGCGECYLTNITIANSYISSAGQSWGITNLANSLIEQNFSEKQWSSANHHGETVGMTNCHNADFGGCSTACPQGQCNFNNTFRFNILKDCAGTACIAAIGPGNVLSMNAWKVYGNVFVNAQVGDGMISNGGNNFVLRDVQIYNNTFVACPGIISKQCDGSACSSASGNTFRNNLLVSSSPLLVVNSGGFYDRTNNTYWNSTFAPTSEPSGQIVSGASCPLVDCAIGTTGNYRLLTEAGSGSNQVNIGLTLVSPFNIDPSGRTRGADGTWERGAFEFARPAPPVNLRTP